MERPKAMVGCLTASVLAWGIAIPSPIPVVLCASLFKMACLNSSRSFNVPAVSRTVTIYSMLSAFVLLVSDRLMVSFVNSSLLCFIVLIYFYYLYHYFMDSYLSFNLISVFNW